MSFTWYQLLGSYSRYEELKIKREQLIDEYEELRIKHEQSYDKSGKSYNKSSTTLWRCVKYRFQKFVHCGEIKHELQILLFRCMT